MKTTSFDHSVSLGIGLLTVYFHIPTSHSLKDKRSIVKSILAKIQNEYKVSIAEVGYQDSWQECLIACCVVSNDPGHSERVLQIIYAYLENNFGDIIVSDHKIEMM